MKHLRLFLVILSFTAGFILFNCRPAAAYHKLNKTQMKEATHIFFDRCAGCHGDFRTGGVGPAITPNVTRKVGTKAIEAIIKYGTPTGMPNWGTSGQLSKVQIKLMAAYVQQKVVTPPEMSLKQVKATWKLFVPVKDRPKTPQTKNDWQNYMGVVLRNANKVAIIDDKTKKPVAIIKTGNAIHILRTSADGRYFYAIGRNGKVTLIDLWTKKPTVDAEVHACYDARSVDVSKYAGDNGKFKDKYAIVGCYWPARFVLLDGRTLKPLSMTATSGYDINGNWIRDARVAAIAASNKKPLWVVNVKELGQVWLVNYKKGPEDLQINQIDAAKWLHDGGWNSTHRYFITAANASNKMAVIDTKKKVLTALINVPKLPHPGRGANILNKKFGPMYCVSFIGAPKVACIGTDPKNYPQYAWKIDKLITLPGAGGGSLFIKTNPHSDHIWVDRPLNPNPKLHSSVYVIDKKTLKLIKVIRIPHKFVGRAVDFDYNKQGNEVWVSVWGFSSKKPTAILVYNDKTLKLKTAITGKWVITPTGKFNDYNTSHGIY